MVKFLGGSIFIAKVKIAMDGTATLSSDPPSDKNIKIDMDIRLAGPTVSVIFESHML